MTLRALIIGFLCAFFIAGAGYVNDRILELESFNSGHLLPVIVLGFLFLAVLLLNPLLHRMRRSWVFRPTELALIVVLASVACSIPGRGLMEQFTQNIVMPFHWMQVTPGWKENDLLKYVPEKAFVSRTEENHDEVVTRYVTGSYSAVREDLSATQWIKQKTGQVPWHAWWQPLRTWLPMIFHLAVLPVIWSCSQASCSALMMFDGALGSSEGTTMSGNCSSRPSMRVSSMTMSARSPYLSVR